MRCGILDQERSCSKDGNDGCCIKKNPRCGKPSGDVVVVRSFTNRNRRRHGLHGLAGWWWLLSWRSWLRCGSGRIGSLGDEVSTILDEGIDSVFCYLVNASLEGLFFLKFFLQRFLCGLKCLVFTLGVFRFFIGCFYTFFGEIGGNFDAEVIGIFCDWRWRFLWFGEGLATSVMV